MIFYPFLDVSVILVPFYNNVAGKPVFSKLTPDGFVAESAVIVVQKSLIHAVVIIGVAKKFSRRSGGIIWYIYLSCLH